MDIINQPFPWYVSGPLIATTMFILLLMGKRFGMSSNLRTICAALGADKNCEFFQFNWKAQRWNLIVVLGAILGGFIAVQFLSGDTPPELKAEVIETLHQLGITSAGEAYMPSELFGNASFSSPKSITILLLGGFLVGFGARYAGGCTSGHAISGLSNLQLPSLIAVVGFFIGGLLMVHVLFPILI